MTDAHHTHNASRLIAFAEQATAILHKDERVRILWLTSSLAKGTADGQSDVDLRAAVRAEDFATIEQWPELLGQVAPTVKPSGAGTGSPRGGGRQSGASPEATGFLNKSMLLFVYLVMEVLFIMLLSTAKVLLS